MIHDFDPVWFNLQPSIALILADTYTKYRYLLPKSLRYIELSGEYLTTLVFRGERFFNGRKIREYISCSNS